MEFEELLDESTDFLLDEFDSDDKSLCLVFLPLGVLLIFDFLLADEQFDSLDGGRLCLSTELRVSLDTRDTSLVTDSLPTEEREERRVRDILLATSCCILLTVL